MLPKHLEGLLRPAAYPHPVTAVHLIETQLSWVLVAGERTYKLKRPVQYPFVDQRHPDTRRHLCHEELRLNRRFSPQLYLEVVAVTMTHGQARIGGDGPAVEHAVVMQTFEGREELDCLVLEHRIESTQVTDFGRWLAQTHAQLPRRLSPPRCEAWQALHAAVARNAAECVDAGASLGTAPRITTLAQQLTQGIERHRAILSARVAAGYIRECHADLHLSNVVRLEGKLVPFDCLEFDSELRWIDVAQDMAFLYADLLGYDAAELAAVFLDAYLQESGDYEACTILPLYCADRALVRAKVMALQLLGGADLSAAQRHLRMHRHQRYLEVAETVLNPQTPELVLMYGLPASGKSSLAARLASRLPAVTLRSDLERKRLAGLGPFARVHATMAGGLYSAEQTAGVYERLLRCSGAILAGGLTVIVDANFGRRQQRTSFAAPCRTLGVPLAVVACEAPMALLRERVAARSIAGTDPSDADLAVLEFQAATREPIEPAEQLQVIRVDSTNADTAAQVLATLRNWRAQRRIDST